MPNDVKKEPQQAHYWDESVEQVQDRLKIYDYWLQQRGPVVETKPEPTHDCGQNVQTWSPTQDHVVCSGCGKRTDATPLDSVVN